MPQRRRLLATAIATLTALGLASASTPAWAIIGGNVDSGDPSVPALNIFSATSGGLCTCEIISPHLALTAAHCVDPDSVGFNPSFQLSFATVDYAAGAPTIDSAVDAQGRVDAHFDPQFVLTNLQNGHDIAVVVLSQDATQIPGVVPLKPNHTAITDALVGMPLDIVGYGQTCGSPTCGAGTKHILGTALGIYDSLFIRPGFTGHVSCEGDSGGPGLMTINGTSVIVSLTSFGDTGCTGTGSDTRVDVYASDFVDPWMAIADPGSAPDHCAADGLCQPRGCTPVDPDCATTGAHCGRDGVCQVSGCSPPDVDCNDIQNPQAIPNGGSCSANSDCSSNICVDSTCTQPCDMKMADVTCPSQLSCQMTSQGAYCETPPQPSSGCAVAPAPAQRPTRLLWMLAAGFLLVGLGGRFVARRRRSASANQ
jgi:MYXO-CTERM domain-containing protein